MFEAYLLPSGNVQRLFQYFSVLVACVLGRWYDSSCPKLQGVG